VAIPIYLMYRQLGMTDTHVGMILLYTAVNVSLAVWLLKGFIDEIPREYEEAALVDGYTRLQAFVKTVLPQAATGIAATAVFCLIFAWNEYAFAVLLTSGVAQTMPPFIPVHHRRGRPGLARGGSGHHVVHHSHRVLHRPTTQAPSAWHHLQERYENDATGERQWKRSAARSSPRALGKRVGYRYRAGHPNADAAVSARALHLVVRRDFGGHAGLPRHQSLSRSSAVAEIRLDNRAEALRRLSPPCARRHSPLPTANSSCCSGPSGCGKTTTLRMIAGLELPSSGKILLDRDDVTFKRASQRDIGFVFQLFSLYPHMNVRSNIGFPVEVPGRAAPRD
jgi:hypothetical protein